MKKFLTSLIALPVLAMAQQAPIDNTMVLKNGDTFALNGEVNDLSMATLLNEILSSKKQEVNIVISSNGGSVFAAMDFVDNIKASGIKTHCIVQWAASAAFAITQSCDTRLIVPNGILMQHQASYGLNSQPVENQKTFNAFLLRMIERFEKMEYDRIGWTQEQYFSKTKFDYWVVGEEAVNDGVADKVVQAKCAPEMFENKKKIPVHTFFGTFYLVYSGCPLVSAPLDVEMKEGSKVTPDKIAEHLQNLKPKMPKSR